MALKKLAANLDTRYEKRRQRLTGTITAAPLTRGRSTGQAVATVGGVGGVRVSVSPDLRSPIAVGDSVIVEGVGTPAAMEYSVVSRTGGARPDSDIFVFSAPAAVGANDKNTGDSVTNYAAGDILMGGTLENWSNWWYQFDLGRWQIRRGTAMHGALGDLKDIYGYTESQYGTAFGEYSVGKVNITTDPVNGFRIRNYETPVFQADTSGSVYALSVLRAGAGNTTAALDATDANWRLYVGNAIPANAPFRVDKYGNLTAATSSSGSNGITLDANGIGVISASSTKYFKLTNTSITLDPAPYGYINLDQQDMHSENGGTVVLGYLRDSNNQANVYCYRDAVSVCIQKDGTWRYVLDANFDFVAFKATQRFEQMDVPAEGLHASMAQMYYKGTKLIFQYNESGTMRYKYLDLASTGVTWGYSATAP